MYLLKIGHVKSKEAKNVQESINGSELRGT